MFTTAVAVVGFSFAARQPHAEDAALTPAQIEAIGPVIKDYLMKNPEVVIQAVEEYQKQQEAEDAAKQAENVKKYEDFLYNSDVSPSTGNPKADVTIVEFFDYNCGYCKHALPVVQQLLKEDTNLRFVFKDMPILSPTSQLAAQWALAAQRQGKYFEFYQEMLSSKSGVSEASLSSAAEKVGLDMDKLKKDIDDPKIKETIANNLKAAQDMGIRGTPGFIINGRVIGGYLELDGMKQVIEEVRKNKS
jgi:protein-disulfide isomerase